MSELKFRAFDTENKSWTFVTLGDLICGACTENGDKPLSGAKQVWEQYAGLKDKNGKEIYDGDIVEQFVCGVKKFKGQKCGRRTIWQVRWNEEECCFELHYLSGSLFGDSMMSNSDEYEVIGNIHENEDLIEE